MRTGKTLSFSLEVARLFMLDVGRLGGRHQKRENLQSVRIITPLRPLVSNSSDRYHACYSSRPFQECIHLSARVSTSPGRGCLCIKKQKYLERVGHSSLRIRQVLYDRSRAFRKHVILFPITTRKRPSLRGSCRSELIRAGSKSQPTLVG